MRRIYDDMLYNEMSEQIINVIEGLEKSSIFTKGQAPERNIEEQLYFAFPYVKFGRDCNFTGIGNNFCRELVIRTEVEEEQVFGLIHITDDMFGGIIVYITDIDEKRKTKIIKRRG